MANKFKKKEAAVPRKRERHFVRWTPPQEMIEGVEPARLWFVGGFTPYDDPLMTDNPVNAMALPSEKLANGYIEMLDYVLKDKFAKECFDAIPESEMPKVVIDDRGEEPRIILPEEYRH